MRSRQAALSFAIVSSLACGARADDLGPPPADCPRGSIGHSEHAGEWCAATTCTSDADCTGQGIAAQVSGYWPRDAPPLVCREAALCVVEESYALGGLRPAPSEGHRRLARGSCVAGACPAGGECRPARRCVSDDDPRSPSQGTPPPASVARAETGAPGPSARAASRADEPATGGGCAAAPRSTRGVWLVLALGAGWLVCRRRLGVARGRR